MQSNRECEAQILLPHLLEDGMVFPILCPPPGPKFLQGFFALCKILVRQKQFQVFALRQASDKVSGIEERVVRGRAHSHTSHRNGRPHLLGFKSAERTFCLRKQRTEEKKHTNNVKKQKITLIEAVKVICQASACAGVFFAKRCSTGSFRRMPKRSSSARIARACSCSCTAGA